MLQDARAYQILRDRHTQRPDDLYIQNTAFSYDHALAALAFISDGNRKAESFAGCLCLCGWRMTATNPIVWRNAYVYGDIRSFPGWESGTAPAGLVDGGRYRLIMKTSISGYQRGQQFLCGPGALPIYKEYGGEGIPANWPRRPWMGVLDNLHGGDARFHRRLRRLARSRRRHAVVDLQIHRTQHRRVRGT